MANNKDKKEDKSKAKEKIKDLADSAKKAGEDFRKEFTEKDGIFVKMAAAGMAPLPVEARKNIIEINKKFAETGKEVTDKMVETGKVMVDDYLKMMDNLLSEVL